MWRRYLPVMILVGLSLIPTFYPSLFNELNIHHHRMLTILLLAIVLWSSELIPVYATSLLIILLELVLLSDQGPSFLMGNKGPIDYRSILGHFAAPIIFLFLGGFSLAAAASKYQIDRVMAKTLLQLFGNKPAILLLGLMLITAIFSMFMSNTATAAMMLAVLAPVLKNLPADDPAHKGFLLAIPLAANIGGIGTPIGTPPNAIAIQYLAETESMSFVQWMKFGFPFAMILLILTWRWLMFLYKPRADQLDIQFGSTPRLNLMTLLIYLTFFLTIFLWLTSHFHGMNSYVVSLIPLTIFFVTGILNQSDLKNFDWQVLWLIAGGIALGEGLEQTGLSHQIVHMLPLSHFDFLGIISVFMIFAFIMANFISNTATANLILPLSISAVSELGSNVSVISFVIPIALVCSLGMALPISTPPNALAFSQGKILSKDLLLTGGVIGLCGLGFVLILNSLRVF